jgi:hypothetical protein
MRALGLFLVGLAMTGCRANACKAGTLLVEVQLTSGAEKADVLIVDVASGDASPIRTRLDHTPGIASGRIEVDFPSGYPAGGTVTVTLTAESQGRPMARSQSIARLAPKCDVTQVGVDGPDSGDGGGVGGGGSDGGLLCPGGGVFTPAVPNCDPPVPADPEFKDQQTWTLSGGAKIDPTAPGLDDVGELILDKNALCTTGGTARQSITMPAPDSGPFALVHTAQRSCSSSGLECTGGTAAVRFRDGAIVFPATSSLVKATTCLGARAYGGTFDLVVGAGDKNDCNNPMLNLLELRVDRIVILPEPSCPSPGTIPDADFDGNQDAWQLQLANGTATIDPGIGVNGSQAGHIATSTLCENPKLRGIQSVPLGAQVALSVFIKGTAGKAALLGEETNQARWASVTGTGVFETPRICVPEYAKGMVLPLILSTETPQGACSTLDVRDFVFDDLSFVTEPSCPMTTFVIDPGFERHSTVPQWNLSVSADGSPGQAAATVVQDATQAHGGSSALRLSSKQFCTSAHANTVITVPQATANSGPALKFFYRAPVINNTIALATAQSSQLKLTSSASWQQATLCLDPARAGQGQYFELVLGSAGICGRTFNEEFALFDDFEATTDASCPSK